MLKLESPKILNTKKGRERRYRFKYWYRKYKSPWTVLKIFQVRITMWKQSSMKIRGRQVCRMKLEEAGSLRAKYLGALHSGKEMTNVWRD